jgi:hypothetical protein
MIKISDSSRQPDRQPWTLDRLINERSITLGYSLDTSTFGAYTSALNSYLTFCNMHNFPVDPTPDTLSFFAVYISSHINPKSADSYLSGICRQLEPFFPDVRKNRRSLLVSRTIKGCKRRFGVPVKRKLPFSHADLHLLINSFPNPSPHDDLLFVAQILSGFHALLRLGELVFPDKKKDRNFRKIALRHSVRVTTELFSFFLPSHKGDMSFEGNTIIIEKHAGATDPHSHFLSYLHSRDSLFPVQPELWLTSCGTVPTRHWFMSRLHRLFPKHYGGHSLRAGGATSLAEAGVPPSTIQAMGRWSSNSFQIYIRRNPVVLHALLFGRPAHQPLP